MKSLRKVNSGESAISHFSNSQEILHISINNIDLDLNNNLRESYNEDSLKELANSIRTNGLLEPIGIDASSIKNGKYKLIYGYRRALAISKYTDIKLVRAITVDSKANLEVIQLLENIQREDLSDFEIAKTLYSIKQAAKINNAELSIKINKSVDWIKKKMVHANILNELENDTNIEEFNILKSLTTQQLSPISKLDIQSKKEALKLIKDGKGTVQDMRSFSKDRKNLSSLPQKNTKEITLLEKKIKSLLIEKSKIEKKISIIKQEIKSLLPSK